MFHGCILESIAKKLLILRGHSDDALSPYRLRLPPGKLARPGPMPYSAKNDPVLP